MQNNNYFFNHTKITLDEIFENYYDLTFGFYDIEEVQEFKIKELSKVVKNEVFEKGISFTNYLRK